MKLLWGILALSFLVRVVGVSGLPLGFNADEASFGYDAYSILRTGRDQWGQGFPLVLKSFGDFKSPAYSILSVPIVYLFGLNIFSTRLLSVITGTLFVLAIYLVVVKITDSRGVALLIAFLCSINPWSIMLSRGAVESNLTTLFIPLGLYMFLGKRYTLASLLFGINLFTYHSAKLVTPLVVLALVFLYKKDFFQGGIKKIIIPSGVFAFFLLGLIYSFYLGGGSRVAERSITHGALEQGFVQRMEAIKQGQNPIIAKLFHNRYQAIAGRLVSNYFQYFSPQFLMFRGVGDASYAMMPGIGVLNFAEIVIIIGLLPFFLYGLYRNNLKIILLLIIWILIAPLPAALASGVGYAGNRASNMIAAIALLEAVGAVGWYKFIKSHFPSRKNIFVFILIVVSLVSSAGFLKKYASYPTRKNLEQMLYGNLEAARWLENNFWNRKILVSRGISEPQIFFAFAGKMDPEEYHTYSATWDLENENVKWVDQLPEYKLANYTIKSIDTDTDITNDVVVVYKSGELKLKHNPIKIFYYPDGTPNIEIVDTAQTGYAKAN